MRIPSKSQSGFTLIELLVVVAVVAILAGLLLPALGRAKSAGRSARCVNHVRQMVLGLTMYADDTDSYPLFWDIRSVAWFDRLQPYTRASWSNQLYRCPDYRGLTAHALPERTTYPSVGSYGYSFGYNALPGTDFSLGSAVTEIAKSGQLTLYRAVRQSEVLVPVDMIALGDGNLQPFDWVKAEEKNYDYLSAPPEVSVTVGKASFSHITLGVGHLDKRHYSGSFRSYPPDRQAEARRVIRERHRNRFNIGFCDGHVQPIADEKLYEKSDAAMRRWNRNHEPVP